MQMFNKLGGKTKLTSPHIGHTHCDTLAFRGVIS